MKQKITRPFPLSYIRRAKDVGHLRLWPSVHLVAMVTFPLLSSSDSALLLWLLRLLAATQNKTAASYCHHRRRKSQASHCEASVVFFSLIKCNCFDNCGSHNVQTTNRQTNKQTVNFQRQTWGAKMPNATRILGKMLDELMGNHRNTNPNDKV